MKHLSHGDIQRIKNRLRVLYGDQADQLADRFYHLVGRYGVEAKPVRRPIRRWNEQDVMLITYADMIQGNKKTPLQNLHKFCSSKLKGAIKTVHLLPFYPWSSDDGFSVIDYKTVEETNGSWEDIENLGKEFDIAFDLVLNHCSSKSGWFRDFCLGIAPGKDFFIELDENIDVSAVFRPRTTPLLTKTRTRDGITSVWTTFSPDQVDLNWQNPDLLFEFIDILFWYISKGVRILRLDAVAFCWKEIGTSCIHLPKTHELVKLIHDICDMVAPEAIILTETNVPHKDNISYFGDGDEAHMVYNFSLAPLVLEALLANDGTYLNQWASQLTYPSNDCNYLNFTASHDGVGVGPLKGLLPDNRFKALIKEVKAKGGKVSSKSNPDGSTSPYELNITYASALEDTANLSAPWERFFCSQMIALCLKGIPAVYFHSLMGTPNNTNGVKKTKRARTINRYKYDWEELEKLIQHSGNSPQANIFRRYILILRRRANHPAFHPDADQQILDFGKSFFALRRTSLDREQNIFCFHNLSSKNIEMSSSIFEKSGINKGEHFDIITGRTIKINTRKIILKPYQAIWLVQRV